MSQFLISFYGYRIVSCDYDSEENFDMHKVVIKQFKMTSPPPHFLFVFTMHEIEYIYNFNRIIQIEISSMNLGNYLHNLMAEWTSIQLAELILQQMAPGFPC